MKIEVLGMSGLRDDLDQELQDLLERVADQIHKTAPKFTPKKTGRARAGWRKEVSEDNFSVENAVPYVHYLEKPYVKSKQAPRGIIGPTLTSIKGKI